jgi:hypothetical protein
MSMGSIDEVDYQIDESIGVSAVVALVRSLPFAQQVRVNGSDKLERYGREGYLIKVVVMALAGEVARKLSPIRSWSNNNYKI